MPLEKLAGFYGKVLDGSFDHVHFVWHGGEPTLVGAQYLDHAVAMQKHYAAPSVLVENSMQTNATALSDAMLSVLKERAIGVGISLDAPPDIHDSVRVNWVGKSTLSAVMTGIARLRSADIQFGAICVLHAEIINVRMRYMTFLSQ